jgi:hypothetical protein
MPTELFDAFSRCPVWGEALLILLGPFAFAPVAVSALVLAHRAGVPVAVIALALVAVGSPAALYFAGRGRAAPAASSPE